LLVWIELWSVDCWFYDGNGFGRFDARLEIEIFRRAVCQPRPFNAGLDEFLNVRRDEMQTVEIPGQDLLKSMSREVVFDGEAVEIQM
jgi:hypothetical protein